MPHQATLSLGGFMVGDTVEITGNFYGNGGVGETGEIIKLVESYRDDWARVNMPSGSSWGVALTDLRVVSTQENDERIQAAITSILNRNS